jgi:hypothetical protein
MVLGFRLAFFIGRNSKAAADLFASRRVVKAVEPQLNSFFRYAPIAGASGFTSGPK